MFLKLQYMVLERSLSSHCTCTPSVQTDFFLFPRSILLITHFSHTDTFFPINKIWKPGISPARLPKRPSSCTVTVQIFYTNIKIHYSFNKRKGQECWSWGSLPSRNQVMLQQMGHLRLLIFQNHHFFVNCSSASYWKVEKKADLNFVCALLFLSFTAGHDGIMLKGRKFNDSEVC